MTIAELFEILAVHVAAGRGAADVFVNLHDDTNPAVQQVSDAENWAPRDSYFCPPEEVGNSDGMLVIDAYPEQQ